METFEALVSKDHIYSVINIVLVIQRVSVEVRGELSTKPTLERTDRLHFYHHIRKSKQQLGNTKHKLVLKKLYILRLTNYFHGFVFLSIGTLS